MEWIGEIPEHWEVLECKYGFDIKLGKMIQNNPISDKDEYVTYLKAVNVNWMKVDSETDNKMWATPKQIKDFSVQIGDLLVCEGGEVGRAGIIEDIPEKCIMQNALHRVRETKKSINKFLYYFMHHAVSSDWLNILCNKATIAHFTYEKFGWMKISLPPKEEQDLISKLLNSECLRIDQISDKIKKSITLLKEYRSSLITHAVSGQPVPGLAGQTGQIDITQNEGSK